MQMIICGLFFAVIIRIFVTGEDIRLVNGRNPLQGELQLLMDGIWSYACYLGFWGYDNSKIMCRMLRNSTFDAYDEATGHFDNSGICLYNITCSGNEQSIDECMNGVSHRSCLMSEIVAVRCGVGVHLVDGYNVNEGKVKISVNGTWRWVANTKNSWGNKEANVICRMLGYRSNNATGFHTPTITEVRCVGNETRFQSCSFKKKHSCAFASDNYVSLNCGCASYHCSGSYYCENSLGTCQPAISQRDDLSQQINVNIILVGATFLAGVIIFQIISCAILMRRMGWRSEKTSNTKS